MNAQDVGKTTGLNLRNHVCISLAVGDSRARPILCTCVTCLVKVIPFSLKSFEYKINFDDGFQTDLDLFLFIFSNRKV